MDIVITFPLSLGVRLGGPEDVVQRAAHLASAGARVTVVHVPFRDRFLRPPDDNTLSPLGLEREAFLERRGVAVVRAPHHPVHPRLDGIPVRKAVSKVLEDKPVDIVLGYCWEAALLPALLKRKRVHFGMIACWSYRQQFTTPGLRELFAEERPRSRLSFTKSFVYRALFREFLIGRLREAGRSTWLDGVLRRAEIVFTPSQFTSHEVVDLFRVDPRRIHVSHLGVNPAFARLDRSYSEEVTRLFYFGLVGKIKGIYDALEAMALLAEEGYRDWSLRIAGPGDHRRVRESIERLGIDDKVEILGELDPRELARELGASDLAILPSHAESFGLAIAEAQASGLAVISCHVGAVPEVIEEGVTGWLTAPKAPTLLAAAIKEAITDPPRTVEMGRAGRIRATSLFDWQTSSDDMLAKLGDLIDS